MNHFKLFEEFILESKNDTIIDSVILALSDDIQRLIGIHEKAFQQHFKTEMTAYDRELIRLNIIWDMIKSIEIYTMPSDSLVAINSTTSPKGNLEISAKIERDGTVYSLNTEVIYAGGHNIQRLHFRYITKTNVPKTGNLQVANQYSDRIKKLSKLEKMNQEIRNIEEFIQLDQAKLQNNQAKTEAQIRQEIESAPDYRPWPTWQEIVKRGADKNYNYSEEYYNEQGQINYQREINHWNNINITWVEKRIKGRHTELQKLNQKITKIIQ
jgi:hypothetical protein